MQKINRCAITGTPQERSAGYGRGCKMWVSFTQNAEGSIVSLVFCKIGATEFTLLRSWFDDPELKHRLTPPTAQWFEYIQTSPDAHAWMIYDNDLTVGYVQVDIETGQHASVAVAVRQAVRNHGYCKRILRALLTRPELQHMVQFEACSEPDNIAIQRCMKAVGFILEGDIPDSDGMLRFVYRR